MGGGIAGTGFGSWGVFALASYDDESGPALYAGGRFSATGGTPVENVARRWPVISGDRARTSFWARRH